MIMKKVYNCYDLIRSCEYPIESFDTMRDAEEFVDYKETRWPGKHDWDIRVEYE